MLWFGARNTNLTDLSNILATHFTPNIWWWCRKKDSTLLTSTLNKESLDIYTACCVCDLFKLNCGLFSPLSAVVCTVVNMIIAFWCGPKQLQTLWSSWPRFGSYWSPEQIIYGVNVIRPWSDPSTRCMLQVWVKHLSVERYAFYSGARS